MNEVCHEETTDDDGMLGPCDAPMFGFRIDPEYGDRYPVCRQHYRPPFRKCATAGGLFATRHQCTVHGGVWTLDSNCCDRAFEETT